MFAQLGYNSWGIEILDPYPSIEEEKIVGTVFEKNDELNKYKNRRKRFWEKWRTE